MIHLPAPGRVIATLVVCLTLSFSSRRAAAIGPEPILLWPDGAPGAMGTEDADRPAIRLYQPDPEKRTAAAIVVCPGGGYGGLAFDHEGHQIAEWLKTQGITSVVLRYRLGPKYHHPAPLQDVSRAIRYVRSHAKEWNVSPERIGVMGFSAGGHLASTVSTHFDNGQPDADDPIERFSSRPDFSVLAYPVISFTAEYSHRGSAKNLLGENPAPELLKSLSNETQVTDKTPPTFIFHTEEDTVVPVQNALAYYSALVAHKVPAELHIYQHGPHGVGLAIGDPVVTTWKERLIGWLKTNGLLVTAERAAVKGKVSVNGNPIAWGTVTFTPIDEPFGPVAVAITRLGEYSLPVESGPMLGKNAITIKTMGDFAPYPTIEDSKTLSEGELLVKVGKTGNEFDFVIQ
jgi:acetyl esterase/lipase